MGRIDPLALAQKHKGMVLNIGLVLLSLFIANYIYSSQGKEAQALRQQKETELKKNEELESIRQMQKGIDSYKQILAGRDPEAIINMLSSLAQQSGVKIVSMQPLGSQRPADYLNTLQMNLTVASPGYHALARFICKIENSAGAYAIDSIEIRKDGQARELNAYLKISSTSFKD
jgi:hypothetical protein